MAQAIEQWSEWQRRHGTRSRGAHTSLAELRERVYVTPESDGKFVRYGREYLGPPLWALERARFVRDFARVA